MNFRHIMLFLILAAGLGMRSAQGQDASAGESEFLGQPGETYVATSRALDDLALVERAVSAGVISADEGVVVATALMTGGGLPQTDGWFGRFIGWIGGLINKKNQLVDDASNLWGAAGPCNIHTNFRSEARVECRFSF